MTREAATRFEYGFWTRHAPKLLALVALLFAVGGTMHAWYVHGVPMTDFGELAVWWAVWLFLLAGNVWLHFSRRSFVRPVHLSASGVGIEGESGQVEWREWSRVQRIDRVLWPDLNLSRVGARGGLRFVFPDREILVYESIRGYDALRRSVEREAAARGLEIAVRKAAPAGRRRSAG